MQKSKIKLYARVEVEKHIEGRAIKAAKSNDFIFHKY